MAASLQLVLCFSIVFLGVQGQSTFNRHCHCERIEDGQCAYTLLLPIGSAAQGGSTCPASSASSSEKLASLESNLTQVREWAMQNSQLLGALQATMLAVQNDVLNSSSSTASPGQIRSLTDKMSQHEVLVSDLREVMTSVVSELQSRQQDITAITRNITELQAELNLMKRNFEASKETSEYLYSEVTNLARKLEGSSGSVTAPTKGTCQERGLLVSGLKKSLDLAGISVSSQYDETHGPDKVRINSTGSPGAWCPREPNADYEYVEFDLGSARQVFGVVTRGRADYEQWVTRYKLQYRMEGGEAPWSRYEDAVGLEMVFPGNTDKDTPVMNMLWQPIRTRYVRIVPLQGFRNICMRADVIGCVDADNNNES